MMNKELKIHQRMQKNKRKLQALQVRNNMLPVILPGYACYHIFKISNIVIFRCSL